MNSWWYSARSGGQNYSHLVNQCWANQLNHGWPTRKTMFMERMLTGPSLKGSMCVLAINSSMSKLFCILPMPWIHWNTLVPFFGFFLVTLWCPFSAMMYSTYIYYLKGDFPALKPLTFQMVYPHYHMFILLINNIPFKHN